MRRIATLGLLLGVSLAAAGATAGEDKKPPEGFTALFNGKDFTGWKHDETKDGAWTIKDGTIHFTGEMKVARNLATAKNYKDFELWVDWKITPNGDSGIYLRGRPQVQIWDNKEGSGALWNNKPGTPGKVPLVVADKKPGEWNTMYIKMVGKKVTVKLNGKTVVDNADFMPYGQAPPATGPIELQVHGTPLWFRNLFVKELD
jgi:hypothetical protein